MLGSVRLRGHAGANLPLARLGTFRAELHACLARRADALFELGDALLCAQSPVASLPHLSLEPAHRRGWGSTYAALARGRIDTQRLRDLLAGWAFQWICQLGFDRDSWTAPVDARRLHPLDDTDQTAAAQTRALLGRLPDGAPVHHQHQTPPTSVDGQVARPPG